MKRYAFTLIAVLLLAGQAMAQYTESPIAHLSRAEGTLYVGAGSNRIGTLLSSANARSLLQAENYAAMKTLLAYGTMADQAANSVAITGGSINGATIGASTRAAAEFSSVGIGTSSSASKLTVHGEIAINADLTPMTFGESGAADSYILYNSIGSYLQFYDVTTGKKSLAQLAADTDTLGSIGSVANGDVLIYNSGWKRLGKGDDGQVLKLATGLPAWAADTDTNTTYTAGDGLKLTGTDFDLNLQTGGGLEIDTGQLTLTSTHLTGEIGITIDGAGSEIADGVKGFVRIPYACTITGVYLMADQTGSIVVDVWKDTFAQYPPDVGDTITASAKPTLSSAASGSDTTLTGWTKAVSAGDVIGFNVDSCTTIERLTLQITTTK